MRCLCLSHPPIGRLRALIGFRLAQLLVQLSQLLHQLLCCLGRHGRIRALLCVDGLNLVHTLAQLLTNLLCVAHQLRAHAADCLLKAGALLCKRRALGSRPALGYIKFSTQLGRGGVRVRSCLQGAH